MKRQNLKTVEPAIGFDIAFETLGEDEHASVNAVKGMPKKVIKSLNDSDFDIDEREKLKWSE
ncbi:MAG TPA: hypothetical protein VLU95_08935 [Candidatus Acidoferrum sp.]|nr:hypothetical protein [Candidatus Acidoferrum sp.]